MHSYKGRVENFWEWFTQNEAKLEHYINNLRENGSGNAQEVVDFLASGLNLAIDNCMFETGGDLEVSLASEGDLGVMFLTSYLVRAMPEKFRSKWKFTPWKPSFAGGEMQIHGKRLGPEDIWLAPELDEEGGRFDISFYNKELCDLDEENQAYHIFFMLLEMVLGENVCMRYVGDVQMLQSLPESLETPLIPLSELTEHMKKALSGGEHEFDHGINPCLSYSSYGLDPDEDSRIRYDIVAGFSRLTQLLDDYYNDEESPTFDMLAQNGAKAVFIAMPRTSEDHNMDLTLRNQIADRLEDEVLGSEETGREIGVLIGQAIGVDNCYIDLLLYDEQAFLAAAPTVLKDYDVQISFYDFKPGAEPKLQ